MSGLLLWDFDGTLARRDGAWAGCLLDVLAAHEPGHGVDVDELRVHLRSGFPWHAPEVAHPELCDPVRWWERVERRVAAAYEGVGYPAARARQLAMLAHEAYLETGWELYPDTLAGLDELSARGWRHVVLSNHVPELPEVVARLGLAGRLTEVHTSAATGYEKPHPEAFALALRARRPGEPVWMIGDNPVADVQGAEAVGIPAILVRGHHPSAERRAADLRGLRAFL